MQKRSGKFFSNLFNMILGMTGGIYLGVGLTRDNLFFIILAIVSFLIAIIRIILEPVETDEE